MELNIIHNQDCLEGIKLLPDECVDCIVTSPPYFGLRDYKVKGQIGLESTPEIFVVRIVEIFRECRRVLKKQGTLWLNLGDSYAPHGKNRTEEQATRKSTLNGSITTQCQSLHQQSKIVGDLKPKDLIGIPWMVAFALRADGWYLRSDVIWAKPNPMPESVTDRPTKSHEYVFLLSKSQKYYYDYVAIMQDVKLSSVERLSQDIENQQGSDRVPGKTNGRMKARSSWNGSTFTNGKTGEMMVTRGGRNSGNKERKDRPGAPENNGKHQSGSVPWEGMKANKRSVWTVTTKPFKEAHFATFPPELIIDMIKAGSSEYGCCSKCGASFERSFDKELMPGPKASFNSQVDQRDIDADPQDQGSNRLKDGHKPGWVNKMTTHGWTATCKCEAEVCASIILDPFMGAGTTALVARKLNRNFIGFELNAEYIKIANKRLHQELGMFK